LDAVKDARGVAFLDIDEDVSINVSLNGAQLDCMQGTLDVIVQRTGEQGQGSVSFVQNNFYYDAFFLNAIGELDM